MSGIKQLLHSRERKELMCLSCDKWTSADNTRFIGVYLVASGKKLCLGMLNYVGFCGSEENAVKLKRGLEVFDLQLSDVPIHITDCGSGVRKVSELVHAFHFPCLADVINLIVQRFLLQITNAGNDDDEPDSDDEDEYQNTKYNEVAKISRTPKLTDQLKSAQEILKEPNLTVVVLNSTRWNSVLDMLCRFRRLR